MVREKKKKTPPPPPLPPAQLVLNFKSLRQKKNKIKKKIFNVTPRSHTHKQLVAHQFDRFSFEGDVPSELSFIVFVSVWTMVVTIVLLVAGLKFPKLAPLIIVLALNAITMLFWFAAFIALAVWKSNLIICTGRICDTLIAGIVFGAFEW